MLNIELFARRLWSLRRLPSSASSVITSIHKRQHGLYTLSIRTTAVSSVLLDHLKKPDPPLPYTPDKLASMQKYIESGRKITNRQYEEVLNGVCSDLERWMQLITVAGQAGYFDIRSSVRFLHLVSERKQLAYAQETASIAAKNPAFWDTKFYQTLVDTLMKLKAPQNLVQSIISSRTDLDLGPYQTYEYLRNFPEIKENLKPDLGTELGLIYHLSNENNKRELADRYKKLHEAYPNFVPDLVTFTRIAHALGPPVNDWSLAWSLIQSVLTADVARDVLFYNVGLRALAYCNEPDDADIRIARELMSKLHADGLKANKDTYLALMDVYFRRGRVKQGTHILQEMRSEGVEVDKTMLSRFVKSLLAVNEAAMALEVLENVSTRGTRSLYSYIEEAFVRDGNMEKAAQIRHIYKNAKTRELGGELEKAVTQQKLSNAKVLLNEGKDLIREMWRPLQEEREPPTEGDTGPDASPHTMSHAERYAVIVRTYMRFNRHRSAWKAFDRMLKDKRVEEIDPFISAIGLFFPAQTDPSNVLKYVKMKAARIKPNHIVIHGLIRGMLVRPAITDSSIAHASSSSYTPLDPNQPPALRVIQEVTEYADQLNIKLSKATLDLLVSYYSENARNIAASVIMHMQKHNILDDRAFVVIVRSYGQRGDLASARQIINEMQSQIPVSLSVHNAMLDVYMNAGRCEEALTYFDEMRALFSTPNIDTYDTLVLGLIKNNRFAHALSIYGDLMHKLAPFLPSSKMFGAVVRQLIAHGDGDTLLRLLRDVRGRHVAPTKETYDDIIQFVLGQPDYPIDDVRWILGHAKGDDISKRDLAPKTQKGMKGRLSELD